MSIMFTAVAMAGGFAHLIELPNKITLPYSHAVNAGLNFVALVLVALSLVLPRA